MAFATPTAPAQPLWLRLFYMIPVFGWIARDTATKGVENLYYGIGLVLSLWAIAILTFGYPGLIIPALAMVPTMFVVLIVLSRP
jgi:hypothetical protein